MATFAEHIEAEIKAKEEEIAVLRQHLFGGGEWLQAEAGAIWQNLRLFFSHHSSVVAVSAVAPAVAPSTPPEPEKPVT